MRILIIDDNVDWVDTLQELLQFWGHQVETAYDPVAGVAAARRSAPDVILCDLAMPQMSGLDVCRELQADPCFAATAFVACSGLAEGKYRRAAFSAGFGYYLVKPVTPVVLLRLLEELSER